MADVETMLTLSRSYLAKQLWILISGRAGVGKTTSASILGQLLHKEYSIHLESFATGVKNTAAMMGWDGKKDARGRKLLQDIGRVAREYNEDVWVKQALSRASNSFSLSDIVIVDDWRFPNEFNFLNNTKTLQVVKVRIESPEREMLKGTPEYNDISETSLPDFSECPADASIYFDYIIFNDGDLLQLENKMQHLSKFIVDNAQTF